MGEVSPNRDNWVMGVKLSSETAPKSLKETGPPAHYANAAFGRKSGFSSGEELENNDEHKQG